MLKSNKLSLFILLCSLIVSGCSTKVSVEKLSHRHSNQHYKIQNLTKEGSLQLWWQRGMTLHRTHSKGYVLNTIAPENQGPLSYYSNPKKAKHIGNADGAIISIMDFYEHPNHTPRFRATANIILQDGRSYPCEIEWHTGIEKNLIKLQSRY